MKFVLSVLFLSLAGCDPYSFQDGPVHEQTYATPSPEESTQFNLSQTGVEDRQVSLESREVHAARHGLPGPSDAPRP